MSTPNLIEAFYARIWNGGDLTAVPDLLHRNCRFRGSLGTEVQGHEAFVGYVQAIRHALAAFRCEILACVTEGDQAVAKLKFSGRHVAPFRGFAPTDKLVHWLATAWFRFEDGTIADVWVLGDVAGLDAVLRANQLGDQAVGHADSVRLTIRNGRTDDLARLTAIYNHYVLSSHATFDERPFTPMERRPWLEQYQDTGPHRLLVAESQRSLLGYASSSRYRDHPAFADTVETSVYVDASTRGRGVGRALYAELFMQLRQAQVHRALAAIALPNPASVALHTCFGFREVGIFNEYASKKGRQVSSLWMEKALDGAW